MASRRDSAFSLIELLVFTAIFSFVLVAFVTMLISVTQIQTRESSQAEVNGQSQFLLQQVQSYVERASLVDIPQDTATTTLKLYMGIDSQDPTFITLSNGTVYLQQTATGTLQALTSPRVSVSGLSFTRRANPPGHDAVAVSFTISYNTTNFTQIFSQLAQTTVARVAAATFDSNLVPSSTATYNLGVSGQIWSSINQVINFSGSNVGIGTTPSLATFEVGSGNIRADSGDLVAANSANGLVLKSPGGTCYRITIANGGAIATSTLTCP